MLAITLGLIILAHGLGHSMFLMPLLGLTEWGPTTESWLIRSATPAKLIGSVLWMGTIALFAVAAIGLFGGQAAWRPAVAAASVLSLAGITLFWDQSNNAAAVLAATLDIALLVLAVLAAGTTARVIGL